MKNKQYKIAVIDDEPNSVRVMVKILRTQNYKIDIALNGKKGYELVCETLPNMVIIDWEMPELSGIETIKLLRKNPKTKNIPIIMATGRMIDSKNLKTALESGANDYVRKPIDKLELIARVENLILFVETTKQKINLEKQIAKEREQNLLNEINKNKKELITKTLKIIKAGKFNNIILEKLQQLDKNQKEVSEIISKIKVYSNNINFEEFELKFNKVHKNFYANIQKQFPDLTINDRRICAFLKLNMSSKDISAITFQTTDSIKKARYRLRKKLNLKSGKNISSFLQYF